MKDSGTMAGLCALLALFRQQARFTRPRGVFGEAAQGRLDMWVNWRQLTLRPRGI